MKSLLHFHGRNSQVTGKGVLGGSVLGLLLLIASGPSWAGCGVDILTAGPVDFGSVPVFQTSDAMLVVVDTCTGKPPDNADLSGVNAGDFAVIQNRGSGIGYQIEFTPQAVGPRSANLTFIVFGPSGGSATIELEGVGIAGAGGCDAASVNPTSHDFGNVAIGDSASVPIGLDFGTNGRGGSPADCQLWNVYLAGCEVRGISTQGSCPPFSYSATDFPTAWDATFEPTEAGLAHDTLVFVLRSTGPVRGNGSEFVELSVDLWGNGGDPDSDGDGVLDEDDVCPDTAIPEAVVPTNRLGRNRWALVDDDTSFNTNAPRGGGPMRSFTVEQTGGCSCEQILDAFDVNPNSGQYKFGCSGSTMLGWISLLDQPTQCTSSGLFCGGIAGIQCDPGLFCADDPNDDCPVPGGADCPGLCVYGTPDQCPTWTPLFEF